MGIGGHVNQTKVGHDNGYANVTPINCIRANVPERRRYLRGMTPELNPYTIKYKSYWGEEIKRCVEGLWVKHSTGYMWTPSLIYFYGNYATILLQKHKRDKRKIKSRPEIRDLEWQVGRYWTICRGFSGFSDDDVYSCDNRLDSKYDGDDVPLTTEDIVSDDEWHLFKPNGQHKEFVNEYDYIRRTFDRPMGLALHNNEARDFMWLGSRGGGKSYFTGAIIAHEFLFNGAKEFTREAMVDNASPIDIVVGAAEKKKSRELLKKTRICLDNLPGEYKKGDIYFPSPMAKSRLSGSWEEEVTHSYQVKRGGSWKVEGSMSRILHVAYKDNAEASAGTRASVMVFEEVGLSTNLIDVYAANVDVMMNGSLKFGSMLYLGTSGNMEKIKYAETIFKSPASYSVYAIYDELTDRDIGFFMPYHMTDGDYKDLNGITDLEKAQSSEVKIRKKLKGDDSLDSLAYHKYVINRPEKWQEMFLSNKSNGLPVAEINERLDQLDMGSYYLKINKAYELVYDPEGDYGVGWHVDVDKKHKPLLSSKDDKGDNINGAVVIYEEPLFIDGEVPDDMYIFGHDTYVSENRESGGSLGAFYVIRADKYLFEAPSSKRIVAQYVGKPSGGLDDYYENCLKLMKMYNCGDGNFFFESNRSGHCKSYMIRKHDSALMCEKPQMFNKRDDNIKRGINKEYGVPMTTQMKSDGVRLMRDYLLQEVDQVVYEDDDGVTKTKIIRIVHTIDDRALLEEMSKFDPEYGNFDRFMGFMLAVIGVAVNKYEVERRDRVKQERNPLSSLMRNKFFDKSKLKNLKNNVKNVNSFSATVPKGTDARKIRR